MICMLALFVFFILMYQRIKPVRGLQYLDARDLGNFMKSSDKPVILLDVRDSVDYYEGHLDGAVHISLGRLPFVKKKELRKEASIIVISDSIYHSKKAARILKKSGYSHLAALHAGNPCVCT